jgi:hypothetical protein
MNQVPYDQLTCINTNICITFTSQPHPAISIITHHMQTRTKTDIDLPRFDHRVFLPHTKTKTLKQPLKDSNLLEAMKEECYALEKNKTWSRVPFPQWPFLL